MDLLDPPYERRSLDDYGFDDVSAEFKRLTRKQLTSLQDLDITDEERLLEMLPQWIRDIEGVSAGNTPIKTMDALVDHDEVPAALVQAFVVELISASMLRPKTAKNS